MKQKFKAFLKKFFLINDTSHKVAGGAALGIFLGIIPGEGVLATLLFASIFRLNRLAATAGVLATNMWTTAVTLPLAAFVGAFIFGVNVESLTMTFESNRHLGWKFFISGVIIFKLALPLAAGFILTAGIIALSLYVLIYFLLKKDKLVLTKIKK
jgi:uncharacterized protein (DUF2062 family)